jgi:hypothetical protein
MQKVTAKALPVNYRYPHGTEVLRIEYSLGNLAVHVVGLENEPSVTVNFEGVVGFRVLDERDFMEYWPVCSTPQGWLFEIATGGWLAQENERQGSCVTAMYSDIKEYLVTGEDDCISVLARQEPIVRQA